MAATVTDSRGILDECDSTTGWSGTNAPSVYTSDPGPVELTGCLGVQVSTETVEQYTSITSDNYSGGGTLSAWIQANGTMDTTANGGIQILLGDGTNRIGYHVGGSDGSGFRHETGPVRWTCFVLDPANLPTSYTVYAGAEASLSLTAITQIGVGFKTLSKALGGTENCFYDIIRWADPGEGLTISGGTVSVPGTFSDAVTDDKSDTSQKAFGAIRELASGVYGCQTNMTIGDSGTGSSYFEESGITFAFEDRDLSSTNNYYRFVVQGNATGTNSFSMTTSTIVVPSGAEGKFDSNNANIDTFTLAGSTLSGFDKGVATGDSTQTWTDMAIAGCGQVTDNGADLTGTAVSGYEGTADTGALKYDLAVDPDGELDNMTFTKGTASTHAIEFGASIPASITLRGIDFSGYNASDSQTDSTLYFADTSGTITVNLVGCSGNISYKSAGATIDLVINPVALSVHVQTTSGTAITGARVYVLAATGGPLPYNDSVTITSTSGTATVTHTAHGLSTNQWVKIEGADQEEYNGAKQITVTGANTYTYAVTGTPTTPATGTITSTGIIIFGTTDASGNISDTRSYSSNQPFTGRVRKSSASPYYKTSDISGTVDASNGLSVTVGMISDE